MIFAGSAAARVVRWMPRGMTYAHSADRHPLQFLNQLIRQARDYRRQARHLRGDDRAQARAAATELEAWVIELRADLSDAACLAQGTAA